MSVWRKRFWLSQCLKSTQLNLFRSRSFNTGPQADSINSAHSQVARLMPDWSIIELEIVSAVEEKFLPPKLPLFKIFQLSTWLRKEKFSWKILGSRGWPCRSFWRVWRVWRRWSVALRQCNVRIISFNSRSCLNSQLRRRGSRSVSSFCSFSKIMVFGKMEKNQWMEISKFKNCFSLTENYQIQLGSDCSEA